MNDATKAAVGILLVFLAGIGFFVAFHPAGLTMPDGTSPHNPADVLRLALSALSTTTPNGSSSQESTSTIATNNPYTEQRGSFSQAGSDLRKAPE